MIQPQRTLKDRVAESLTKTYSHQEEEGGKANKIPANANMKRSDMGMAFTKMKPKAGNPNRSYPVDVIDKARARIGGH